MNKKIGVVCILLVLLMILPVVGYKMFTNQSYKGNVSNAQEVTKNEDLRGVWIASVSNIDFPSKPGISAEKQKKELDTIVDNAQYMGLNAIFFQVRPTGDALYKSSIFPWSAYLTGKQGKENDQGFDPLAYIIQQAHKKDIQVHAWINPLRLSMGTTKRPDRDVSVLSEGNPARNIPEAVVAAPTGQLYLDPGNPAAIKLITDGVAEIVKNYDIDGIHFDDYFYPSKTETDGVDFNDSASYEKYKGSFTNKDDWRRNNVDTLVKNTYDTVKKIKPNVQFGISPFAIWSNKDRNNEGSDTRGGISTYYDYYADSKKWVKEEYLDYIAPQIYWNIGFKAADYSVLVNWWKDVCSGTKVKLYVGHAAYKINDTTQANEWLDPLQIPKQIAFDRKTNAVSGSIFYGYSTLKANTLGIKDKLHGIFVAGRDPGSVVPEDRQLFIASPDNGYKTSSSKISILGAGDPEQPVYLNGKTVQMSAGGYFTVYEDLKVGENTFTFKHKGKETVLKITRKASSSSVPYKMTKAGFREGYFSPTQSMTMQTGQKVSFSCQAPAGAKVWVEIGSYRADLSQTATLDSNGGALTPAKYSGTFTMPAVAGKDRVMSLGKPVFAMELNGKKITAKQSNTISVQSSKYYKYAVVSTNDAEAVARSGPSSEYSRVTPLINGAADYIVGQQNGFYLLKSGTWTAASNIKVINDKALTSNRVSSVGTKANGSYTDITFNMPVNAVFGVEAAQNTLTLTLYNTEGINTSDAVPSGAPFSSVSYKSVPGGAQYTFNLRSPDNYFGYNAQYKNGALVFSLKNAPKISKSGSKPLTGLKVVLDAGHGGSESGAIGPLGDTGLYEKQINLAIALNVRKYLQSLGATDIMTRTSDKTVSLNDRANLIRNEKPDIAVAIHNNSMDVTADYTKNTGLLVLYSKDSSKAAAGYIKDQLVNDLKRKDDGYRWQSLSVCTVTQSPAILIEGGFLSNPDEYAWLADYDNQVKIGNSVGKAIENWAYKNAR
ncbi:MAG TPA: family 10 glycosylhydrolase [Ruminiclostridium sp.]|nr:family 10 glycosylhydrolase [Ruminiclostridium sp.]